MIPVYRCTDPACSLLFPERPGTCPNCGGQLSREERSGDARVLAATELHSPAEGFSAPHRLLLVELEGGGRTMAVVEGALPSVGARGRLERSTEGRHLWRPG